MRTFRLVACASLLSLLVVPGSARAAEGPSLMQQLHGALEKVHQRKTFDRKAARPLFRMLLEHCLKLSADCDKIVREAGKSASADDRAILGMVHDWVRKLRQETQQLLLSQKPLHQVQADLWERALLHPADYRRLKDSLEVYSKALSADAAAFEKSALHRAVRTAVAATAAASAAARVLQGALKRRVDALLQLTSQVDALSALQHAGSGLYGGAD
jgi:hypothetical protein